MNIFEAVRVAWMALMTHKLRALLTMLGIIIGVGAVIGMQAIGNGFQLYLTREFDRLGAGTIYVTPGAPGDETENVSDPRLTAADARALLDPAAVPAVARVAIEYNGNGIVSAGRDRFFYTIHGITPSYFEINAHELGAGRFFSAAEEQSSARVVVIGRDVASDLFGGTPQALGQRITIDGVGFDVIGVLTTRPNGAGGGGGPFSQPTQELYLPYETARTRLFRNQMTARVDVSRITAQAVTPGQVSDAIRQITLVLRNRHRLSYQPNDFDIQSVEQTARQAQQAIGGFSAFLLFIGGLSLLVGGIGIMNIMLVSVTQRTREIGLRKAVGARRRDILQQFLIEALTLSLLGGALGIGLGYLLSFAGTWAMRTVFLVTDTSAVVTMGSIVLATGVSAVIGVVFGLFPALRAASLEPVRALRSE
jgi:putative ABC transport system permease protein